MTQKEQLQDDMGESILRQSLEGTDLCLVSLELCRPQVCGPELDVRCLQVERPWWEVSESVKRGGETVQKAVGGSVGPCWSENASARQSAFLF